MDNIITSSENEIQHFDQTMAFWIHLTYLRAKSWSLRPYSEIAPSQTSMHTSKKSDRENSFVQLPFLTPNMVGKAASD